ncbi:hypothetical protein [Paenibacillus illinoisensis]|uniref:Uncharacterized protein n=1 Tax=Paenibacillus illinoisensis TaxID=59845 RepID=A0A2W0C8J2_9BACL|nr:hypothetical protein [Paenibacillus illinoisensis]PYY28324.1 Uncharacterized protein PIL02S_03475 [Paenibacillus illinoisensis]
MKTKIRFGFKSKNQLPLFMVWREWNENGETVFAKVLFMIKGKEFKRLQQ